MTMHDMEDKLFKPQEAEEMVAHLRRHLREADTFRAAGQLTDAAQQESAANALIEGIIVKLKHRLERYARAYFSGNEANVEDAIVAMTLEVCRRLKNLTSYAAFEGIFNRCVKHAAMDAAKKVRRENGMDMHGRPNTEGYQLLSAEALSATEEGTGSSWEEQVPDPAARDFEARVLGEGLAERLIACLPTPRHSRVFECRIAGMEWSEVAARERISSKTAKKYYDASKEILRALVLSTDT